tara:strand:- start:5201 stop:6136 length:936 start_codon:yes stop_codon:yes gene_type:complete
MKFSEYFDPKITTQLFGYEKEFNNFSKLFLLEKLPKVTLITGYKGIGKSTLISHLLHFYFDRKNYNKETYKFDNKSVFHNQFKSNLFSNIIYLNGSNFKDNKIEDLRSLKNNLSKPSINFDKRFIIFDDVEVFKDNSLNALLKIIEEPYKKDFFILINNKSKPILETIKSRCIEFKIKLDRNNKNKVIESLISSFNQKLSIETNLIDTTPGNFLRYNHIINEKKIDIQMDFLINLQKILDIYKKEKNIFFKEFLIFLTEYYLIKNTLNKTVHSEKFIENRSFIVKNINDFFLYNLNQNTLLNILERKFIND